MTGPTPIQKEDPMKYLYLLYADESKMPSPGSPEMGEEQAAYGAFYEKVTTAGVMQAGDPVHPSAASKTVSSRGGEVESKPGPFSPGGEQIVGFYVLDVSSEQEAVEYAAMIPAARHGAVEVRPILQLG
ncbi:MAG TPA: YciI family protein [Candidatus Dormibacteraeota bacterium]|nr:YciI family protein [Candidatus Dormibacteraeota bacterium]